MIEMREEAEGRVIGLRCEGRLRKEDYEGILPRLDLAIGRHGKVALLVEIASLEGMEPAALWQDLRWSARHFRDVDRCAVVSDKRWIQDWTNAVKPFLPCEVQTFERVQLDEAWSWIRRESGPSGAATA